MASLKPYTITVTAEPGELLTVEQYATLPDEPGWKTELEEGKVIRMPLASFEHGRIVYRLVAYVGGYAMAHDLGEGTTEQSGYDFAKVGKVRVRAPDFAFLSHERLALARGVQYPRIAPDLAVEVVSPSQNTQEEMRRRAQMWLEFGARLVWVIWPDEQCVDVWTPDGETPERLRTGASLDGQEVLPGFTLPIAKLFGS